MTLLGDPCSCQNTRTEGPQLSRRVVYPLWIVQILILYHCLDFPTVQSILSLTGYRMWHSRLGSSWRQANISYPPGRVLATIWEILAHIFRD